jgi:D-hydroxyproline dehydrogenase subunit gamma
MGFHLLDPKKAAPRDDLPVTIDGVPRRVPQGISVAAALLLTECAAASSLVDGSPRAPYCMMGVCFDCLAAIDGVEGRQSCLLIVREGMAIERNGGRRRREPSDA